MIKNFGRYAKTEPFDTIYYYVNEDCTTIAEFIELEHASLDFVVHKKYRIFKSFDTQLDFITVGKN